MGSSGKAAAVAAWPPLGMRPLAGGGCHAGCPALFATGQRPRTPRSLTATASPPPPVHAQRVSAPSRHTVVQHCLGTASDPWPRRLAAGAVAAAAHKEAGRRRRRRGGAPTMSRSCGATAVFRARQARPTYPWQVPRWAARSPQSSVARTRHRAPIRPPAGSSSRAGLLGSWWAAAASRLGGGGGASYPRRADNAYEMMSGAFLRVRSPHVRGTCQEQSCFNEFRRVWTGRGAVV